MGIDPDAGLYAPEGEVSDSAINFRRNEIPQQPRDGYVRGYHSGPEKITAFRPDTSFAMTPEESVPYLRGKRGWMTFADVPESSVADEKAIRAAAKEVGFDGSYVFEMADSDQVQAQLRKEGYQAVRYRDMGPDNRYEHATLRIIDGEAAVVGHARISPSGRLTAKAGLGSRVGTGGDTFDFARRIQGVGGALREGTHFDLAADDLSEIAAGRRPIKINTMHAPDGAAIRTAADNLKRALDGYAKWGRAPGVLPEGSLSPTRFGLPPATQDLADLANRWRTGLEDSGVWGAAGDAQARENLSFSSMKARWDNMLDTFGVPIDEAKGVRIPEIDYSKTRSVLEKITGNPEIDEALQPIKSARAAIDGMRDRLSALRETGEIGTDEAAKMAVGEKNLSAFEASLNGAMKEAARVNRLKAAVLEEGHSGMGGLLGAALDTVTRPLATMRRLAQIKHTYDKVVGGIKSAFRDVADAGGSSTEGLAARPAPPRPKEKIVEEMQSIRAIANNPAALESAAARMVGDLSGYAPQTADALRLTAMRALIYLAREAPPASVSTSDGTLGAPKPRYSDVQIHDWEDKRNAAFNPADVVQDMKHGRLNRDAITAAKYVAPQMFAQMQELARDQIAAMGARGELDRMPYQQKAVIAALLEVPADRTFEPDFMAMMQAAKAQATPAPTNTAPGGAQPVRKSNQKPMADMFMTASGQIEAGGSAR
jgi:hypothetical protein